MNASINVSSEVDSESGAIIFSIRGHFDSTVTALVSDRIENALKEEYSKVVFDVGGVVYISSAGLRILLAMAKKMKAKEGGGFALYGTSSQVKRVLDASGMAKFLPLYEDRATALSLVLKQ